MNKVYVLEKLNMMEGMPNFFYAILKSLVLLAFIAFYCVLFDNVSITTKCYAFSLANMCVSVCIVFAAARETSDCAFA